MTDGPGNAASYAAAGVDIEAGDRAVELMKAWVAKASRPEVVGGIGGFAGLFDASALTSYRASAARHLHRRRRHQGRHRRGRWTGTTPSATTWSAWSSTTSSCAAPSRCS